MERHTTSYVQLIKPGITLSNTLAAIAGFFLAASATGFRLDTFIGVIAGVSGVIASACVVNNIYDRNIDKKMKRTRKRGVPAGEMSLPKAWATATIAAIIGFSFLTLFTNQLTTILGVVAFVWYVVIYGLAKRTTPLSTIIGGVPGALPPVAGYTAVTGQIDTAAILLFAILFFWQLPHFYAISMFRQSDYASAKLPVWSVKYGMKSAKLQIFISVILYAIVTALLAVFGYTGIVYLVVSSILSVYWIYKGVTLYRIGDDVKWARAMFGVSLVILLAMCLLISIGGYLP